MASSLDQEEKMSNPLPEMNPDFLVIRIVGRIVLSVIKQCWALSSAMFITICFFYWNYGGFVAFLLLCFSAAGNIHPQLNFNVQQFILVIVISQELCIMLVTRCYTTLMFLPIQEFSLPLQILSACLLKAFT